MADEKDQQQPADDPAATTEPDEAQDPASEPAAPEPPATVDPADAFTEVFPVSDAHSGAVARALLDAAENSRQVKVITYPRHGYRVPSSVAEGLDLSPDALLGAPKTKKTGRRAKAAKSE